MIFGTVRSHSPRVRLTLPGAGRSVEVEFVLDTGFEGDFALPNSSLAMLDWENEVRLVEILELPGRPLLGMMLLSTSHIHVEGNDGGEIVIEPL